MKTHQRIVLVQRMLVPLVPLISLFTSLFTSSINIVLILINNILNNMITQTYIMFLKKRKDVDYKCSIKNMQARLKQKKRTLV